MLFAYWALADFDRQTDLWISTVTNDPGRSDFVRPNVELLSNPELTFFSFFQEIKHPFLISLSWSCKDSSFLYLLFPYVCGGELFSYLRSAGRFSPSTTLFYSAEIVSALEYLHSLSVAYRDLKPENLLLDRQGHIVITDFGFAKVTENLNLRPAG